MTIDLDALREALERECCGAFYGGGFGGAMVQATASPGGVSRRMASAASETMSPLSQYSR